MKKGPYPRIAQALGVEVGERFVYKDPNKFFPSIRPRNEFNLIEIIGGTE